MTDEMTAIEQIRFERHNGPRNEEERARNGPLE